MTPKTIRLLLLGFGNVGQALARLFLSKATELHDEHRLKLKVVGIVTGRHGAAIAEQGLDLSRALELAQAGQPLDELSAKEAPNDIARLIEVAEAEAVLESIPVNYDTGQPAVDYLKTALEHGLHAITANKGPVVHAHGQLSELADSHGRRFLFESSVMDGAPIFSTWREALPGARPQSFRGILNSTTNFILSEMEGGKTFQEALAGAQSIGIAETDPSGDVEGWDAAVKVAALVTVLMKAPLNIHEVERTGISQISSEQIASATEAGQRWKLICTGWREGESVRGRVAPALVDASDPLYQVMGTSSAVTFTSDVLGDLTIMETNPSPATTAYGMLADLLNAVRAR